MAAILSELSGANHTLNLAERSPRFNGLELPGVAHEDELRFGTYYLAKKMSHVTRSDHSSFVENNHRLGCELKVVELECRFLQCCPCQLFHVVLEFVRQRRIQIHQQQP